MVFCPPAKVGSFHPHTRPKQHCCGLYSPHTERNRSKWFTLPACRRQKQKLWGDQGMVEHHLKCWAPLLSESNPGVYQFGHGIYLSQILQLGLGQHLWRPSTMFFQSSSLEDHCEIVKHNETFLGSCMVVAFDLIFAVMFVVLSRNLIGLQKRGVGSKRNIRMTFWFRSCKCAVLSPQGFA